MTFFSINDIPKIEKVGVYAIRCKATDKYYIGSAFNVYARLITHSRSIRLHNELPVSGKMDEDIKKYGKENIEFAIIKTFENNELKYEELYKKEKEYVIKYNSIFPNGYNTYLPSLTNSKKIGTPVKAITTEETKRKVQEYIKETTIKCDLPSSYIKKFRQYAKSQGTTANALLKQFVLETIKKSPD